MIIMAVTNDEYELPVAMSENLSELSRALNVSRKGIYRQLTGRVKKPFGRYKFVRVNEVTNEKAIKIMSIDELAMLFRLARYHIAGWSYQDLLQWLDEPDNITETVKRECERGFYSLHG